MRIGFYNPYFDGFGGGERYVLTLASHWSKEHDVFLFWDDDRVRSISEKRFQLDLTRVRVTPNIFKGRNIFKKSILSNRYDLIFFLSDGSVPTTFAKHNILHFQVPFQHIHSSPLKLYRFQSIVVNSYFTKEYIDPKFSKRSTVIYPPVDTNQFRAGKKEKFILSVGRFTSFHESKKQEVLIEAWKQMGLKDWKFILVGGLLSSDQQYFNKLQKKALDFSIELKPNVAFSELRDLYARAPVYWHAAGFDEKDPMLMEHFGISTVEAMASGCIPVVYKGGGLTEIVDEGVSGFTWASIDELIEKTTLLIRAENSSIQNETVFRSKKFDIQVFQHSFDEILHTLTQ